MRDVKSHQKSYCYSEKRAEPSVKVRGETEATALMDEEL